MSAFLNVPATTLVKTLVYLADGKPVAALVRGDRDVNEIKLKKALGVEPARAGHGRGGRRR